ncbi:unnamed protein product [Bemisia tabaci]|uniref:Telomeric single stranded DNA binding POT1/Cdc13 domain-containing protein n=1 Tax=Bemisia tabaci TaxID=7038 RepID=A0A9P0A326_BEMTA|nr:unnamed protein product [Bemisia tabaci]
MSGPISQVIACEHNSPLKFYEGILAALGTDHVDSELPLKPFTECGIGTTNNNTLTIGAVSKVYPLKRHVGSKGAVKIIILEGALKKDKEKKSHLRVMLFNECAEELESAEVQKGNLIGFYGFHVIPNSSVEYSKMYSKQEHLLEYQITVKCQPKRRVKMFFTTTSLETTSQLDSIEQTKESKNDKVKITKRPHKLLSLSSQRSYYELPELKRSKNDEIMHIELSDSDEGDKGITRTTRSNSQKLGETKGVDGENNRNRSTNVRKEMNGHLEKTVKNSAAANVTNGKKVDVKIINGSAKNSNEFLTIANHLTYKYTKLIEAPNCEKMHCYAVVTETGTPHAGPTKNVLRIKVTDDSLDEQDIKVSIFYEKGWEPPLIRKHQIIRFHRLRLELFNGNRDGSVNSQDFMVFNPEECDATAKKIRGTSWAKKYVTFTEEDAEIIFKIKEWINSNLEAEANTQSPEHNENDMILTLEENAPAIDNAEKVEALFETIDKKLSAEDFTDLKYESVCHMFCQIVEFHKLDDDHVALRVKRKSSCPLKLTVFPLSLRKFKTVNDCLSAATIEENRQDVSILLKNTSAKPVFQLLQDDKDIFILNCKIPPRKGTSKADQLITLDISEGDIISIHPRMKQSFKKSLNNWKKQCNEIQTTSSDKPVLTSKEVTSISNVPVKKSPVKKLKKFNEENFISSDERLENVAENERLQNENGNGFVSAANSDLTYVQNTRQLDDEELALSQVRCITKSLKEGKDKNIPVSNVPPTTKLSEKGMKEAIASICYHLHHKQKAEKQTADVNTLDEVLSLSRRASTTAAAISNRCFDRSFDSVKSSEETLLDCSIKSNSVSPTEKTVTPVKINSTKCGSPKRSLRSAPTRIAEVKQNGSDSMNSSPSRHVKIRKFEHSNDVSRDSLDPFELSDAENSSTTEIEEEKEDDDDDDDDLATVIIETKTKKSPPRPVTSTPRKGEKAEDRLSSNHNTTRRRLNDDGGNYYLLIKIKPTDENNGDPAIVTCHCRACQRYVPITSFPINYMCPDCQKNGKKSKLQKPLFLMIFHLLHLNSLEHKEVVLRSPRAEEFLGGCSVNSFIQDEEVRKRILSSLKKLSILSPPMENGVFVSQKLSLQLGTVILGNYSQEIVSFEIPKGFKS